MKMEEMVEFLRSQGFVAVKQYDPNARAYVFTIAKDGVTVTDDFVYPVTRNFSLKDKAQRDFLCNLMTVWENRKFYSRFTDKKGESNMKDNDNLMYALAQTTAGHLDIMGKKYPVMVREVTSTSGPDRYATPETILTCELMGSAAAFLTKRMNIPCGSLPKIKDVIFNPPATIVFWADNTKTVVKCQEGDDFDPEKGLTMAITKKIFGNKGNYCEEIKKWVKKYKEPEEVVLNFDFVSSVRNLNSLGEAIKKGVEEAFGIKKTVRVGDHEFTPNPDGSLGYAYVGETKEPEKRWKIWWKRYDKDGKTIGSGTHHTDYACKSSATRAARKLFYGEDCYEWAVSQDNPWEKD